jgi:gas vesicle protein
MARKKGGLLFGIIMGTLVGVLFAPGKGKQLRDKLLKEIQSGNLGTKTIGKSFKMMGRDIVDVGRVAYENPRVQKNITTGGKSLKKSTLEILDKLLKTLKSLEKGKSQKDE